MKIYINDSNENWICDRIRSEFINNNSEYITDDIFSADVIWLLSNWIWRQIPVELLSSKKVVVTIHHIDPDKLDVQDFIFRDQFVDAYHVSCEKTIKNFPNSIDKQKIHIMPYWYNEKIWRPVSEKHTLRQKFSIPENKFVIGSFQRDTEGSDLKTPKLSKGPDIFCDIVERLDPKPHILLSGWRRQYVISRLTNADITYSYFELVDVNTLNELYNCLDLYLVTSRYEGGPQAVIECASNKTPILSTDVGIANQALIEKCILNDTIDFINNIKSDNFDYSEENYKKIQQFKMGTLFLQYLTFFKSI